MRYASIIVAALIAALPLAEAKAAAIYRFQHAVGSTVVVDATFTRPKFITEDLTLPISDFSVTGFWDQLTFDMDGTGFFLGCADFGLASGCDFIFMFSSFAQVGTSYAFADGAFETPGTYTANRGVFTGTLTVTEVTTVPTPTSLALFGVALAGLGLTRRRS